MDDNSPDSLANLSAGSAASLRTLEERAKAALAANREQVSRLEAEITAQLDAISARLADECSAGSQNAGQLDDARTQAARISQELARSRDAWLTERNALERTRDDLSKRVAELQASQEAVHAQHEAEQEAVRAKIERLASEFETARRAWDDERVSLYSSRDELAQQIATLEASHTAAGSAQAAELESALKEIERLSAELETASAAWHAERSVLERTRDELAQQLAELNASQSAAGDEHEGKLESARQEIERLNREMESVREALLAERTALQQARDQLAQLEASERSARDEWKQQLEEFEGRLREQQTKWTAQRTELDEARAALERERDGLQQKFDLALADVQRLRCRVAELEQELARRPEANQSDSAELVALRAERDALSERVEELERHPTPQVDDDAQQHLADLQRRFELAVEDVRDLKTANSKLEAQLAAAGKTLPAANAGGDDWESQKRRLLASLEDEGETNDEPERQKERVTIEGTIEMTDAVVAEKDREIAELKSQLASGADRSVAAEEEDRQRELAALVDSDEVIAEHRKRIGQIEREMEEKLRAAELELSLERAKLARQKVELDELRINLDSQRPAYDPNGNPTAPGAPRRRWLSKLGLSGDEQGG
jgi:chromosome segregation ATPase